MMGDDSMEPPNKLTPRKEAKGLLSRALHYMRSPSKLQSPKDAPRATDDEIVVESNTRAHRDDMAIEGSTDHLPLVSTNLRSDEDGPVVVEISNRKRPAPRQDPYDVQTDNADDVESPRKKREGVRSKASKGPINPPRTSKGPVPNKIYPTRGRKLPSNLAKVPITNGNIEKPSGEPKGSKAKRGRPPKKKVQEDSNGSPAGNDGEALPAVSKSGEGIIAILDNPTPEKPSNSKSSKKTRVEYKHPTVVEVVGDFDEPVMGRIKSLQPAPTTRRSKKRPAARSVQDEDEEYEEVEEGGEKEEEESNAGILAGAEIPEEQEDERGHENGNAEEAEAEEVGGPEEEVHETEDEPLFVSDGQPLIKPMFLKDLLAIANRVGRKEDENGNWVWQKIQGNQKTNREKLYTPPGRSIARITDELSKWYKALREAREGQNKDAVRQAQEKISAFHEILGEEIEFMKNTRLKAQEEDTAKVIGALGDIYFNLVPKLLLVIIDCAEANVIRGTMRDNDLQEFGDLLRWLHELGHTATRLPTALQPTPKSSSKGKSYQISKPTRTVVSYLAPLLKKVAKEMLSRQKAKDAAERGMIAASQAEDRAEEDAERRMELKRAIDERNELLNKAIEKKLQEPIWGPLKVKAMAEEGIRARSRSQTEEEDGYEIRDAGSDDPFDDDYVVPSASVRSSNTARDRGQPKALSKQEMETFVEIMRAGDGDDRRYWRASENLGRGFDEIMALAKDFQDAMDMEHENGKFMAPCDQWTHRVYVERDGTGNVE